MKPNTRVLVTGGLGFIGSNLVNRLLSENYEVTVLDNLSSGYKSNIESMNLINFIEGDIRDADIVDKAVRGCSVIFHLAASVGNKRSIEFPLQDAEINVIGTLVILEAAKRHNIKKIVISSSAGIFGELKEFPITENHPVEPDSPYGCTKLCEEKLSLCYSKLYPIDIICLRYFNVYGINQRFNAYGNVIPIFVHNAINNKEIQIFGDGEQTRDFINVNDVVEANLLAARKDSYSGTFNIGSGIQISINELVMIIRDNIGVPLQVSYQKERLGDVKRSLADITLAQKNLLFLPRIDITRGLAEYINWVKDNLNNED